MEIEASRRRAAARGIEHDVTPLRRLKELHDHRIDLDREVAAAVTAARAAGWSWAMIALQLDVTVQAAHKRYATH